MLRRVIATIVLFSLASSPVAGASTSGWNAGGCEVEQIDLHLTGGAPPLVGGVAAELISAGFGQPEDNRYMRSPLKEGAASFLLPGLGQHRMGHGVRSKIYFGLEGAAWIAIGAFYWQGYARENAYRDYAIAFAGVSGTGHSDDYYEYIGNYLSNEGPGGYNEFVRREARDMYYPDIQAMEAYYEANKITGEESWRWSSERAFERYGDLRRGSRFAYRRALYTVMFALALRVVSTVDAVRLARSEANPEERNTGKVSFGVERRAGGVSLFVGRPF